MLTMHRGSYDDAWRSKLVVVKVVEKFQVRNAREWSTMGVKLPRQAPRFHVIVMVGSNLRRGWSESSETVFSIFLYFWFGAMEDTGCRPLLPSLNARQAEILCAP